MISYNEEMMKDIFSKLMFNILKNYISIFTWNSENWKSRKAYYYFTQENWICYSQKKQELNRGLVFKKAERLVKFNQKSWLKPYIDNKYQAKEKSNKWLWERLFEADE